MEGELPGSPKAYREFRIRSQPYDFGLEPIETIIRLPHPEAPLSPDTLELSTSAQAILSEDERELSELRKQLNLPA